MGFNISGLVIDKNYKDEIDKIETILGTKLVFEKEVVFEEASENWKSEDYCDIYFSQKGTLIFTSKEKAAYEYNIESQKAFSFAVSEISMSFAVNLTENCKMIRSFFQTKDGTRHQEVGGKLPFEEKESEVLQLIHHLIESTLGKSFRGIDLEENCYRYRVENRSNEDQPIETNEKETPSSNNEKQWWRFW